MSEDGLKAFGAGIQRLINKEDLSREEIYSMFREVLTNKQPDLQQGAFLAALVGKGETAEEIAGAWQAIDEFDTVDVALSLSCPVVENSGTGMDALKTFNVSSAAGVVAASCGATIARHGARALTSFCGTVDISERIGVDVECPVETVEHSIITEGIGLFNGMSSRVHPSALGRILSQIRFGSTLNIAASLANPARPTHAIRGVYAERLMPLAAKFMPEIGYRRGMIVHGKDDRLEGGMDELSITGQTLIQEFDGEASSLAAIRPEDVGLRTAQFEQIAATGDLEKEAVRFVRVLSGVDHEACIDFTCLNSGAVLYIAGIAKSIADGVEKSRASIASGAAIGKLGSWVTAQNTEPEKGKKKFEQLLELALIS